MKELFKNVTVLHRGSPYHLQSVDILIVNGIIEKIGANISDNQAVITEGNSLFASAGLCDIGTGIGEPGNEQRETIHSLKLAALKGGYTELFVMPDNEPVTQNKATSMYFVNHPSHNGVRLHPLGALSKDTAGQELSEYLDMYDVGVRVFCDGLKTIQHAGLMSKALQYASGFGGAILHHPCDKNISKGTEMHEGTMSSLLGLKGEPDIAELNILHRDLLLNEYYQSSLIIHAISAARSVVMIQKSKQQGNSVSATVAYKNLIFTDQDLQDFNANLKLRPVLRTSDDKTALFKGVLDGTIDAIISNHVPLEEELKNLEFPYVTPGASGLETCLPASLSLSSSMDETERIVHALTLGPRRIMGSEIPALEEGVHANICIFDGNSPWKYTSVQRVSGSANTPFDQYEFKAKVIKTYS
jgi:dihydroorotase